MLIVILIYDQILFRPLVAWADRFRFEQEAGGVPPQSWVFDVLRRSRIVERLTQPFAALWRRSLPPRRTDKPKPVEKPPRFDHGWIAFAARRDRHRARRHRAVAESCASSSPASRLSDVGTVLLLGLATLTRVVVLIALASVIWVPIGVWVGTRPRAAEHGPAGGAIPRRLSGQPAVPDRRCRASSPGSSIRISGSAR